MVRKPAHGRGNGPLWPDASRYIFGLRQVDPALGGEFVHLAPYLGAFTRMLSSAEADEVRAEAEKLAQLDQRWLETRSRKRELTDGSFAKLLALAAAGNVIIGDYDSAHEQLGWFAPHGRPGLLAMLHEERANVAVFAGEKTLAAEQLRIAARHWAREGSPEPALNAWAKYLESGSVQFIDHGDRMPDGTIEATSLVGSRQVRGLAALAGTVDDEAARTWHLEEVLTQGALGRTPGGELRDLEVFLRFGRQQTPLGAASAAVDKVATGADPLEVLGHHPSSFWGDSAGRILRSKAPTPTWEETVGQLLRYNDDLLWVARQVAPCFPPDQRLRSTVETLHATRGGPGALTAMRALPSAMLDLAQRSSDELAELAALAQMTSAEVLSRVTPPEQVLRLAPKQEQDAYLSALAAAAGAGPALRAVVRVLKQTPTQAADALRSAGQLAEDVVAVALAEVTDWEQATTWFLSQDPTGPATDDLLALVADAKKMLDDLGPKRTKAVRVLRKLGASNTSVADLLRRAGASEHRVAELLR
jgi:hypothetical protein